MSAYFEALESHNAAHDPKAKTGGEPRISDENRLRRFHNARKKVANDG